jgi:alkanesulfonate monooxygenase SsuD/methylene tetrahydromethanopterin reductase-like flavin-dependent oxidoreductase (luciferase family)
MCDIAPGRFVFGVGTSSEVIVQKWNAVRFNRPVHRVRDTLRFLRLALAGEKVTEKFDTFEVNGFRLGTGPVSEMPKMLVAALRPAMLKLAAAESDGAIVNWMAPEDLEIVRGELSSDKELVVRAKVIVSDDWSVVRAIAVRSINAYFHVDAYRKSQEWLGRGEVLAPMWNAWQSGDRRMASELIPDDVIDALFVWGGHERIRSGLENYATQGATTVVPVFYTPDSDLRVDLRALAPSRVGPQL